MFDIVCVGGVTHDIYFKSKFEKDGPKLVFPWGEKTVVDAMDIQLGGGGANAAVGFSRLGLKTALLSRIGAGHISESVLNKLGKESVSCDFIIEDPLSHTATSILFLDTASGDRTIVMHRGDNDFFSQGDLDLSGFLNTKWLYIADLAASADSNGFIKDLVDAAYSKQVRIAFTPAKRQLSLGLEALKGIFEKCEVVIMNKSEWDELTDSEPLESAHSAGAKIVVVTEDAQGVAVCTKEVCAKFPAPQVDVVVDTTGAGDAFSSGFITALVKDLSLEQAVELGTRNAGSVISRIGAQAGLIKA